MTRTSQINPVRAFPYLAPGMTGFFIFIVIPLVFSFIISLFNWQLYGIPTFVGIKNYVDLFNGTDSAFMRVLLNTAIFAVFYTTLNLVLSTLIAVWLHSIGGKLAGLFRVIFFVPVVTPMVANALIWRLMFDENGVVNAFLSIFGVSPTPWLASEFWAMVVLVMMSLWQIIGYNIVVLGSGLNNINPSVLEAAKVDGAGPFKRFFKVIFPLLSPALFFCTVMTLIGAFKIFAQPYMLTKGGPGDSTTTIVLYLYNQGFSYDKLGYASAIAWVLFVIVMLITALQFIGQKKWVNYDQ
ncbi:ABC transporter, permease protein [Mobiluncus mulieris 28-1]|uniref:Sugar ABC transporter permease n=1 Tax=Mobiluncus mulieris TaxID=2052 RepID=A0A7Y0YHX8_9ACTO|nr:sugar ABC transporter permease [Mobiluncus mulieris]EEZ91423.1 ABC transporter, permease protein [Mobiluncus mulieris 28-1]EFN93927.1 ABC transporter, permease protein [Mobiluncus mulieris FB024-16]MCU9997249.1 sugar ABC transporter permease [Mobiluncus mulieris]NMX03224.1 sugar ABC transporter permease [Mobiluncus mulieris]